jgi:transcriptional regulator with XRE-family HTH domain
MSSVPELRYCATCATRLARDNSGRWCGACTRKRRAIPDGPPDLPREFWYTDQMLAAFATWHIGKVIEAYRTHPYHARELRQVQVCRWLGITQGRISAWENAEKPPGDLAKLIHHALILKMPAELLWFKLPKAKGEINAASPGPARVLMGVVDKGGIQSPGVATYTREGEIPDLPEQGEPVKRRDFLNASAGAGAAALAATPTLGLLAALGQTPVPSEIRPDDIELVRSAALAFQSLSFGHGGGVARQAVAAQLRWAAGLLDAKCPGGLRTELFSVVADLSGVCAFMAFDAQHHDDARRMYAFGLSCAEEVSDWHERAVTLINMAQQAIWCADPDSALTSTELALVRPDRLTASMVAEARAMRARALARLGRFQEARRAIDQADEAFATWEAPKEPRWRAFYTGAEHAAETGYALHEIAMRNPTRADPGSRLRAAVSGYTDAYVRSRAMSGATLATLLFTTGDPHEAVTFGNQALNDAQDLHSRRVADRLRRLRQATTTHPAIPDATDLAQRITDLVGA